MRTNYPKGSYEDELRWLGRLKGPLIGELYPSSIVSSILEKLEKGCIQLRKSAELRCDIKSGEEDQLSDFYHQPVTGLGCVLRVHSPFYVSSSPCSFNFI